MTRFLISIGIAITTTILTILLPDLEFEIAWFGGLIAGAVIYSG